MRQLISLLLAAMIVGCTQVDTEAVGGRNIKVTTWNPAEVPEGCGGGLKELDWTSQTDITSLEVDRRVDGSVRLRLGETRSSTEIALAMARVAEIQVDAQRGTVGDVLDSSVIAQIIGAALGQ